MEVSFVYNCQVRPSLNPEASKTGIFLSETWMGKSEGKLLQQNTWGQNIQINSA